MKIIHFIKIISLNQDKDPKKEIKLENKLEQGEEVKLKIISSKIKEMKKKKTDYSQFYSIIKNSIGNITLSGYLETDYTINRLKDEIDATRPNGVIFHVIRGRKTEDADSVNYDKLCEKCGISYFKIETDYQENDIEQLRLRIEAFREILV